jgi:hypothetical protein
LLSIKRNTAHLSGKRKEKRCLLLVVLALGFTIPHTHTPTLKRQHPWQVKGEKGVMMGMEAGAPAQKKSNPPNG